MTKTYWHAVRAACHPSRVFDQILCPSAFMQEALHRCSCAIDVVASILPFQAYEAAETVLRMQQTPGGGYLAQEFRVPASTEMVRALREAQAEADVRCF